MAIYPNQARRKYQELELFKRRLYVDQLCSEVREFKLFQKVVRNSVMFRSSRVRVVQKGCN